MWARFALLLCVAMLLSGCGGGSSQDSPTSTPAGNGQTPSLTNLDDLDSLTINIDFPLNQSLSLQPSLSFSGSVFGVVNSTDMRVVLDNGIEEYSADVEDGRWVIPDIRLINSSTQSYVASLVDNGRVLSTTEITLTQNSGFLPFGVVDAMTLNESGMTAYLVQDHRLMSVNLDTGERVSELELPKSLAGRVIGMEVISTSGLLLLLDQSGDLHYRVTSGVSNLGQKTSGWNLIAANITAIARSADGDIYAYDASKSSILEFDSELNLRNEMFLDVDIGAVRSMALAFDRRLVMQTGASLVFVNLVDSSIENMALSEVGLDGVDSIAVDPNRNQIYLRSTLTNQLYRLNLETNGVEGSDATPIDLGSLAPHALGFSPSLGGVVIAARNELHHIDADSNEISLLSGLAWGGGADWVTPSSLVLSEDGQALFVSDLATDDIYQVPLSSGFRGALNTSGDRPEAVSGMVQSGSSIYSVDWVRRSVLMTEVESGITQDLGIDTTNPSGFSEPISIDMDAERFRVFVLDRGKRAIYEVDTLSGNTQQIVDGQSVSSLTLARDIRFDQQGQRIFWSSWVDNGLHQLNLNNQQVEPISDSAQSDSLSLGRPSAIALNSSATVAYVTDALSSRILSVDLDSGSRSLLHEPEILLNPKSIDYDDSRELLYILDGESAALYALNPDTGDLLLVSM